MFNNISYNVVVERFKAFADGHFLIRRFTHGQVDQTDLDKDQLFPWMHVAPVEVRAAAGARVFTFDVIFADIPRDKEDKTDYQKESISDCIRLAEDLLSEIQNGQVVFSSLVEVEGESTITPFIEEWTHTLSGCTLALTISVPNDYSACDIPADWSIGGGGSGTPPSPFPSLILKVNNIDNVVQNVLDLVDGDNVTIEDLGDGRVRINSTGGGGGGSAAWGAITGTLSNQTDLQTALNLKADISSLGAVAFSNDYNDLDNLPTIPAAQVNSDWNASSGVTQILNKPTIPAAQVNADWNATSGLAEILNKPTGLPPTGTAGGDLSGTYPNPTVDGIHGIDMQSGTPSTGDVWLYEGSPAKWQHQQLPAVHVGNDSAVTGSTVKDALNHLNTTKVESNAAITPGTATKVTYDAKGLITSGTTLSATDLPTGIDAASIGSGTVSNTEFGYLDGVTSAIQTQINAKQNSIGLTTVGTNLATLTNPNAITYLRVNADNTVTARTPAQVLTDLGVASSIILARDYSAYSLTGTTTNTIVWSQSITANSLQSNDFIEWFSQFQTNTPNGTSVSYRIYINTSASLAGASLLGTYSNTVGTGSINFQRNIFVTASGVGGNLRICSTTTSSAFSYFNSSGNLNNVAVDTTVTQHLIVAIQHGNTTATSSLQSNIIRITR